MFNGCTSLTEVDLGLLDFWESEYAEVDKMFYNCTSLTSVKWLGRVGNNTYTGEDFISGMSTNGTFYYKSGYDYNYIIENLPETWTAVPVTE